MSSEILTDEVAVVTTAAELQQAVATGAPNIELRAHIDLSSSPPVAIPPHGAPKPGAPVCSAGHRADIDQEHSGAATDQ